MCPQIAPLRGGIFTLITFVNRHIQVIFVIVNVHDLIQFDASSFAASVQLTQKRKIISLRHLQYGLGCVGVNYGYWIIDPHLGTRYDEQF